MHEIRCQEADGDREREAASTLPTASGSHTESARLPPASVWLLAALASSALAGCASPGLYQTAGTAGRGEWELAGEVQLIQEPGHQGSDTWSGGAAARYGVLDALDLTGRVGPTGVELGLKLRLTPEDWPLVVAVAPSGHVPLGQIQDYFGPGARLPVLVGWRFSGGTELVFSAQMLAGRAGDGFVAAGGSVGLALPLLQGARLLPVLTVMDLVDGRVQLPGLAGDVRIDGPVVELGVAVLLGAD